MHFHCWFYMNGNRSFSICIFSHRQFERNPFQSFKREKRAAKSEVTRPRLTSSFISRRLSPISHIRAESYMLLPLSVQNKTIMCFQSELWIFTTTAFIFSIPTIAIVFTRSSFRTGRKKAERKWSGVDQKKKSAIRALSSKCHVRSGLWEWVLTPQDDSFGKYAGLLTTKRGLQYDRGNNTSLFRLRNRPSNKCLADVAGWAILQQIRGK